MSRELQGIHATTIRGTNKKTKQWM
jgi:hypothetical protein